MKLPVTLLLVVDLLIHSAVAQQPQTFQIRHYTTENGLPANGIKGMEWDEKTGFLWLATEAGVVRFNGIDFKTYTNKNTPSIESERFHLITRNNNGIIYAADESENIFKVQKNELVLHKPTRNDGLNTYRAIYGLSVSDSFFNHKVNHPSIKPLFSDAEIPKTWPLTDTSTLVINNGNPVVMTLSKEEPAPLASENAVAEQAFKIGNQVFLVSKDREVLRADVAAHRLVPVKFDEIFANEFNKGDFYFFGNGGDKNSIVIKNSKAWALSYNGTMLVAEEICDAVPVNVLIRYIQYSREKKLLFIGTDSKGFFVITKNRVTVVKKSQTVTGETNAYYSQIELPANRVLTDNGDVLGSHDYTNHPPPVENFRNCYLTSDSLLWYNKRVTTTVGLSCYNYKTGLTKEYDKIPINEHFGFSFSGNKIYIANNIGLGVLQGDSLHYFFYFKERNWVSPYTMAELSPGVFAVSCCQLYRCNILTGIVDTLLDQTNNCVRALWKYKDYLFIGTYGKGYFIYKNGKMKAMPLDKNNFLAYVHGFVADKYGYCWMSTNRGLFKSRLADLINAFEHTVEKIYYHYFGRNDGMDMTEMNGSFAPYALQLQNGTISFPTMDGLLWVDPNKAIPVLPEGDIYIDGIQEDNKKIDPDSMTKKGLPPDAKEIVVQLGYSAWCNKENLYLDYDLNNSGKWKPVSINEEGMIRLYGLSPGNYILRVRKMNGFGPGNYSYNEFHFSINTPWYQQSWFYILAALIALGLGSLYIKLRTRQYILQQRKLEQQVFEKTKELQLKNELLEKNDTIKTRLISIISHDIITPLKFLSVAGRNLVRKKQMMSEEMQNEAIEEITNTSQNLEILSTNILNWIKYQNENRRTVKENINLHEKVNKVLDILKPLAHQKQQHLLNNVDDRLLLYQYAEPLRILIYNLVMNAINFTEKGNIVISNRQEPGYVTISVKDEGMGMTSEQISNILSDPVVVTTARLDSRKGHGLGYLIIKDLIKMIGGEIIIDSEKGKGTTVSIKIP
jgi:signal transduction histidine kinase